MTSLHHLPINVVLFPCCLSLSRSLSVLEAVVTAVVEAVVVIESVLSPEQTIVERHDSLILGLIVKVKRELTNYNCFNGRSSCSIPCTNPWTNGAHINIWWWTDGEVSLMMSGCFTSTHQSDEKELRHSTWACNTHL